jgi:hypothetical protein
LFFSLCSALSLVLRYFLLKYTYIKLGHIHTHTYTYIHIRTHKHTHTYTYIHTNTHTHTHTQAVYDYPVNYITWTTVGNVRAHRVGTTSNLPNIHNKMNCFVLGISSIPVIILFSLQAKARRCLRYADCNYHELRNQDSNVNSNNSLQIFHQILAGKQTKLRCGRATDIKQAYSGVNRRKVTSYTIM